MLAAWLEPYFTQIWQRHQTGHLPHAILISGMRGLGKRELARGTAQSLMCTQTEDSGAPCCTCKSCQLFLAETHPDLLRVAPEEAGKAIKIDQVREFCTRISKTSQFAGYRIGLVEQAEAMNVFSQNSLLKTLEEPPPNVLILLLSERSGALLPTLRSRCQRLNIALPSQGMALNWLQSRIPADQAARALAFAGGAPMLALQIHENQTAQAREEYLQAFLAVVAGKQSAVEVAAVWSKAWNKELLRWVSAWISDLIRVQSLVEVRNLSHPDAGRSYEALASRLNSIQLFHYLDWVQKMLHSTQAFNTQLLAEDLLIRATQLRHTS